MTKKTTYKNFEICSRTFLNKDFSSDNTWHVEGNIIIDSVNRQSIPLPNNGKIYQTENDADAALEMRAIKYINGAYAKNLQLNYLKKNK